ncbi:hypothetical protein AMJ83_03585 [candidate division WOR_3 bacterium SM23_42]|uniref:Gingipain domain-containing protein n=1 Tax=candidate division WOR_3 bacterium SM23_42 TaxID=1703779 RepID=A0A0S8FU54_UNCW3|nr:MAG: hypothetical protein AMJ83_03585 [candidate division WOR_3 bacterium SM23_42]
MIIALLSLLITSTQSTEIQHVDFYTRDIQYEFVDGYTKVRIKGCEITDAVGAPEIPVKAIRVALPANARVIKVQIIETETEVLEGEYLLSCAQPPAILSREEVAQNVLPDQNIYDSERLYPRQIIELSGVGQYDNSQICELLVYPLQYKPKLKQLVYHKSIEFRITHEGGMRQPSRRTTLGKLVINPEDIIQTKPFTARSNVEYLMITNPPMDTVFERLAQWKTKKGIPTQVRTRDWILSNYTGEDDAACIRNYIKTLPDSNTQYVLLGGDTNIVPCRFAYAMTCSAFIWDREDSLPCDLYYADLQGDWNFDDDGLYGEVEDSIDLYPDLLVGRAPVSSIAQAQNFVDKILTYEKNPPYDYLDNALLLAEILWWSPYTDQAIHKNNIEAQTFPPNLSVTKLYESSGNESRSSVMAAIRDGQNIINHDGHGSTTVMGVGSGYLNRADCDTITNAPEYGILFSIGCWTAAFDFYCIAEAWMNNTNGGGVAFIGNSSYGWGSPGNPGFGYSDIFDNRFFYSLLVEDNHHIGEALSMAKAHFIPYSREKNVYRWHQYQLNLLGDPEMMVWTALPESIAVAAPQSIPLGSSQILFMVTNKNTGEPIKDALVCLMKGEESYASGRTDVSGQIFLEASPTDLGDFDLTVSGHNYISLETTIPVVSGSYVNYRGWLINDSLGNADAIANPNEDIFLSVILKNEGSTAASNINLTLRSQDSYVTIEDSTEYLGVLSTGDSLCIDNAFGISIGNATNGHTVCFELEITETSRTLTYYPGILIGTPILSIAEFLVSNAPTMPGDTAMIYLNIANTGYGCAHAPIVAISTTDPYVTLLSDSILPSDIPPETTQTVGPFSVAVAPTCPSGHHPQLSFTLNTESYSYNEDIALLIGETGFADNIESGSGLWTTGGQNNMWHVSELRSFSPTHSWYCGQEINGQYGNNMNCYIQTVPFMVDHNSTVRFRRWFEVPIYGSDGIYVIVMRGNDSDTLDFIGTGGALGNGRGIQGDWFEESYSLDQYSGGDTIQIRIAFVSDYDGSVAEGFYIDDVNVESITAIEEYVNEGTQMLMLEACPNPFRSMTDIRYETTNANQEIALKIYDVSGRMVKSYTELSAAVGHQSSVMWDGTDENGRELSPGVYFIRLSTGNAHACAKAVLVH